MGGGASAGGGRAARALRLLLLLVLALAAVEYLFGSILDASPLRTYLYTPLYNATQPTLRNGERPPASIPKSIPLTNTANYEQFTEAQNVSVTNHVSPNNVIRPPLTANMTISKPVNITQDLFAINEATPTSVLITKIVEGMKNGTNELNRNDTSVNLPVCETRTDLGPIPADKNDLELDVVEKRYPEVQWGGRYTPPNCTAKHKVAIIVPYRLPYEAIFGGVSAMTLEQFNKVNGFSNKYWGWGGEDDDMYYRLHKMNYHIARYKMSIARYAMLQHKKSPPNPKRYQLLSQTSKTFHKDGLSTLEYEVVQVMQYHLYTHILANIDERS
ncbi:hypothetical protein B5X24_HaOG204686 [Helicoverpa armigera]|uniref:Beta-1,4-N-acetylgalactosaminyltransferase n=1 Tax=Helicoverpa armigera TaxID=29058 RepID=A0A2W1BTB1_HELAM|nr:hypothetical protein B5X24_HaOG204686 [Helicoverpa armigera]